MSGGRFTPESARLDDAARAGWLYYVAGMTQDQIARELGVSLSTVEKDLQKAYRALAELQERFDAE